MKYGPTVTSSACVIDLC